MKKIKSALPKVLQLAIDQFPSIVAAKKTNYKKKQKFIERTFGALARKVHLEVHGKSSSKK